ncbi:MAG: ribulose-phosphate 3-epimerase [Anaerolineae bacterium]|jgi:ribulose-phosphate 3-epimerase|nr:ribulose-phosphate 3-epimerase [Anaerolineae bacterium]
MEQRVYIAPSILSADFAYLGEAVHAVEAAGADWVHVDVMDGHFVPNITIGPMVVEAVRRVTRLPLGVHLMIEHPERYVEDFARAGATALFVHPEATLHLHRTLGVIHDLGVQAGVALNPSTSEEVLEYVLPLLDEVLVMTVNPGFGGQSFIRETLPKIRRIRQRLDAAGSAAWLAVDGGIDATTAPWVVAEGANLLVAGSAVFRAPDGVAAGIVRLRTAAAGGSL